MTVNSLDILAYARYVVRIGNSRGMRLPKPILEQCGIGEMVDLAVEDRRLIVKPLRRPREGWAEAARAAAARRRRRLLDPETPTAFDRTEWSGNRPPQRWSLDVYLVDLDPTVGREIKKDAPCVSSHRTT